MVTIFGVSGFLGEWLIAGCVFLLQDAKTDKSMSKEMKVTGCVAQGAETDHYVLNNAMMSDMDGMKKDSMKKDSMKMDTMKAESDKAATWVYTDQVNPN